MSLGSARRGTRDRGDACPEDGREERSRFRSSGHSALRARPRARRKKGGNTRAGAVQQRLSAVDSAWRARKVDRFANVGSRLRGGEAGQRRNRIVELGNLTMSSVA